MSTALSSNYFTCYRLSVAGAGGPGCLRAAGGPGPAQVPGAGRGPRPAGPTRQDGHAGGHDGEAAGHHQEQPGRSHARPGTGAWVGGRRLHLCCYSQARVESRCVGCTTPLCCYSHGQTRLHCTPPPHTHTHTHTRAPQVWCLSSLQQLLVVEQYAPHAVLWDLSSNAVSVAPALNPKPPTLLPYSGTCQAMQRVVPRP